MDQALFRCPIEVPEGSRSQQTISLAQDGCTVTETFQIEPGELSIAIQYILGYARVESPGTTARLTRKIPARHPVYKGLRATRIVNITTRGGPASKVTGEGGEDGRGFTGGTWKYYYVTVQFEQPIFRMLPDTMNFREYARWATFTYKPNIETIERRDRDFTFVNVPGVSNAPDPQTFPGSTFIRQAKGILECKWYDVPEEWTHLGVDGIGPLLPTNILRSLSTVNSKPFPYEHYPRDQNQGGYIPVQFPAGTLLFLEPECAPRPRYDPVILQEGSTSVLSFPRSNDWMFRWLVFDPPLDPANTLTISNPAADPTNGTFTVVRGHNLLPLPTPSSNGYSWYPAVSDPTAANIAAIGPGGNIMGGDKYLQYQFANHELIFDRARSYTSPPAP